MRKTAKFMDSIDHLPSKQLLKQAGFTDQDINQEVNFGRRKKGNFLLYPYLY